MAEKTDAKGPDFRQGFAVKDLPDHGIVAGRVGNDEAVLARNGETFFAVGAHCTHYHGPLKDGVVVGDTIRCPWHHACFRLTSGAPIRPPALDPVTCWRVERVGDAVYVRDKVDAAGPAPLPAGAPASIVIIGGGAAGLAAAQMLRREGYAGPVTMLSADSSPPPDRPNLSKDYLAGTAQEDWIPLRSPEFYVEQKIDLVLQARVGAIDVRDKRVHLDNGKAHAFDRLLIATGADPVHLDVPGASPDQLFYLRSFDDSRRIVARAASASTVVVVGSSFIGLEVAASLRARNLAVHVVAPESQPLERILGPEVGRFVRKLHEDHGVVFHLGQTVDRVDGRIVTLKDGSRVDADFLVLGVGVRPAVAIAEQAGLSVDRGILVNEYLETSAPGVFAAGDVARWPDPHTGDRIRVEHWVVAERMGQVAARNMLGRRECNDAVPFFWSQHYDVTINYVGHAEKWDVITVDGSLDEHDASVTYRRGGRTVAVATVFRDKASLEAEIEMESAR